MVLCIIALPVFVILAVFSAKYRDLAKESFHCVFRTMTLRKCDSALDERLKSHFVGRIMTWNPSLAKWTYKYFNLISWILVVLMIASFILTAYGLYNYIVYGNCNGAQGGACVIKSSVQTAECLLNESTGGFLKI